jgi:hypothetical protein
MAHQQTIPHYRYLRGFVLDPGFSTHLDTAAINEAVYRIPYEENLQPGPRGEYIEVFDFDPASGCWYDPVDLNDPRIASQQGLTPSEGDPRFHQQFTYAVSMKTIMHFERALGRRVIWSEHLNRDPETGKAMKTTDAERYVPTLRIHPHGFRGGNAYYDPDKKALLFGYFNAADVHQGANYPGGLVFTCLSPDIVAHEMTHALLDTIHDRFIEDTNPDVGAFHEGFADIVALLQRFTFRELVEHQLSRTGGRWDRFNILGELATQFGEALEGNRGALRSMIGKWNAKGKWVPLKPSPTDYQNNMEPHDRGAVLVATIFDAFQRIYDHRTRDLLRIASNGTGVLPDGSISPDLVKRLAGEACEVAAHLLHICIRALDYCPPMDITFGNYLRALITADLDVAPEDENGYRIALIEAFRARGIFPERVNTLSVESLRWNQPELTAAEARLFRGLANKIKLDVRELVALHDRKAHWAKARSIQAKLNELLKAKESGYGTNEWEGLMNKLGLTSRRVSSLFGKQVPLNDFEPRPSLGKDYVPPLEVHSVRPCYRIGRENRLLEQVVITLTQSVEVNIGTEDEPDYMKFRGGCTLLLDLNDIGQVQYVVTKNVRSYDRFTRQRDYMTGADEMAPSMSSSLYASDTRERKINFNLLHQH